MDIKKPLRKRYCTPQQVEEMFGIPVGTLANMRWKRTGPNYFPTGSTRGKRGRILYSVEDVENWIRRNPVLTIDSILENRKECL